MPDKKMEIINATTFHRCVHVYIFNHISGCQKKDKNTVNLSLRDCNLWLIILEGIVIVMA